MSIETAHVDLGQMERMDALVAVLPPLEDAYVIDLGCGEGEVARALARRGARVAGYDPFINEELTWTREGDGEYRLTRAGAEATPEPDGCADAVLFVYSLHHVPKASLAAALREAHRLLKPAGRLCVLEPVAEGSMQYVMEPYHDETVVRRDALAALAEHAAPMFEREEVAVFFERTVFADFDAYATRARLGMRFNDFTVDDVVSPEIRRRFAEMATLNGGRFDQPVRINLFSGRRDAQ